jgi:hypothetical protein
MKSKEKLNNIKKISHFLSNFQASRAPKFSGPKPAYFTYAEVNSHVWRGPVNIGFTGPGRALDAPVSSCPLLCFDQSIFLSLRCQKYFFIE